MQAGKPPQMVQPQPATPEGPDPVRFSILQVMASSISARQPAAFVAITSTFRSIVLVSTCFLWKNIYYSTVRPCSVDILRHRINLWHSALGHVHNRRLIWHRTMIWGYFKGETAETQLIVKTMPIQVLWPGLGIVSHHASLFWMNRSVDWMSDMSSA